MRVAALSSQLDHHTCTQDGSRDFSAERALSADSKRGTSSNSEQGICRRPKEATCRLSKTYTCSERERKKKNPLLDVRALRIRTFGKGKAKEENNFSRFVARLCHGKGERLFRRTSREMTQ